MEYGVNSMEELREMLNRLLDLGYDRTCNLVVSVSQRLDKEIVKEMKING